MEKFANQLNNQGIDPNDGKNDVEQAEDVPVTHKYKFLVQHSSRQCDHCAENIIKCYLNSYRPVRVVISTNTIANARLAQMAPH